MSDGPYDIFPYLPSPLVKNKSIYALPYYPDYNEGKIFLPFVYASYTIPQNIHWENDGSLPICISVLPYIPHIPPFWHVCMSVINGWCSQFPLWNWTHAWSIISSFFKLFHVKIVYPTEALAYTTYTNRDRPSNKERLISKHKQCKYYWRYKQLNENFKVPSRFYDLDAHYR